MPNLGYENYIDTEREGDIHEVWVMHMDHIKKEFMRPVTRHRNELRLYSAVEGDTLALVIFSLLSICPHDSYLYVTTFLQLTTHKPSSLPPRP